MHDNYNGYGGTDRREPKISQNDYLTLSRLSKLLKKSVAKYLRNNNMTILDFGCGQKPYQPFFLGKNVLYIGTDIKASDFVDILCDGKKLPFKDSSFHACLCLQVLEHAEEPQQVVDEIYRVLDPQGFLFLSTHGNWPIHDSPHDYWRWTEFGLKKILKKFEVLELFNCGGPAASIIQLLELFIPPRYLGSAIIILLNIVGDFLDNFERINSRLPNLVSNYFIVAMKKN